MGEKAGIIISTIVVTTIVLIFGDAIPKTMAFRHAEKISFAVAGSIRVVSWIFLPFVLVLSWITTGFGKMFGARPVAGSFVSEQEIRSMINAGQRDGAVEDAEAEMLHKVFEFGDRPAREIMVPRTEVVWMEKGTLIENFFKIYSNIPILAIRFFEEGRDNVIGVISSKDMLMSLPKVLAISPDH